MFVAKRGMEGCDAPAGDVDALLLEDHDRGRYGRGFTLGKSGSVGSRRQDSRQRAGVVIVERGIATGCILLEQNGLARAQK